MNAVKDLSLEIAEEEFFVIVGPSGAGKTTTLKLVAGLLPLTSGRLYIGGKLANSLSPAERNVAMTFESYALYPHKTVFENIANPLRSPGMRLSESEIGTRVHAIAEMLGMGQLLERHPRELSGGQKQRVALGRAMVRRPSIFLLDEPLSHVDAKVRQHMRVELNRLQKELKTTTIYVTHDYGEALSLGIGSESSITASWSRWVRLKKSIRGLPMSSWRNTLVNRRSTSSTWTSQA